MCGIVGLFIKNPELETRLGQLLSLMLMQLTERGPDSAGFAIYRNPVEEGSTKITVMSPDHDAAMATLEGGLRSVFGDTVSLTRHYTHAVLIIPEQAEIVLSWLYQNHPEFYVTSSGNCIEIFKEIGLPRNVITGFGLPTMSGTHALGHTRMATESAVTTRGSHPFSTGLDVCLVHNGSLSNHNRLRETLRDQGIRFGTENDSEVAAGYLQWRLAQGDSLDDALNHALEDLDGFYTFAIGTRNGFAVLRDPIGCKPAIMAQTNDWVAMASEFRAISCLPGVENATLGEPEPGKIYSWEREGGHA